MWHCVGVVQIKVVAICIWYNKQRERKTLTLSRYKVFASLRLITFLQNILMWQVLNDTRKVSYSTMQFIL